MSRRTLVLLTTLLIASLALPAAAAEKAPHLDGLLARVQAVWSLVLAKIGGGLEPLGELPPSEAGSRIGSTIEPGGEAASERIETQSRIGTVFEPGG